MTLFGEEAARITQYLEVQTRLPDQADLVFVFGTRHPEPARIAADLILGGMGGIVVLTGGGNRLTGTGEADAHLQILLDRGVPRKRTIVESESTNTLENVVFALPKIESRVSLETIGSIVVVTKWYHCRRAMMTLKRHLPKGIDYYPVTYEPQRIGRSNWWRTEAGRRRVLKEWDRIARYIEAGDIAEIRDDGGAFV